MHGQQTRWFRAEAGMTLVSANIYVMGMVEKLEEEGQRVKEGDCFCGALFVC